MSWHTVQTKTSTMPLTWYYESHIVVPMDLVLQYQLRTLYLLQTAVAKKPKAPV